MVIFYVLHPLEYSSFFTEHQLDHLITKRTRPPQNQLDHPRTWHTTSEPARLLRTWHTTSETARLPQNLTYYLRNSFLQIQFIRKIIFWQHWKCQQNLLEAKFLQHCQIFVSCVGGLITVFKLSISLFLSSQFSIAHARCANFAPSCA